MQGFLEHVRHCEDAVPLIEAKEEIIIALQHIGSVQNALREKMKPGSSKPRAKKRARNVIELADPSETLCAGAYWRTDELVGRMIAQGIVQSGEKKPKRYVKAFLKASQCNKPLSKTMPMRGPSCLNHADGKPICAKCHARLLKDKADNLL